MIKNAFLLVFTIFSMLAVVTIAHAEDEPVRHIVAFKYKDSATEDQIKQLSSAFRELQNKIPGIISYEQGINNSPEDLNKGFTHVYVMTFKNAKARDEYLPHPEHKKFGELLGELDILEDAFVVDYSIGD